MQIWHCIAPKKPKKASEATTKAWIIQRINRADTGQKTSGIETILKEFFPASDVQ
jgi:hypothetical protein